MRQDKLTAKFQAALADAQSMALGRDHQLIEPAHVMLALLDDAAAARVRPLLMKAGADVNKLRSELGRCSTGCPRSRARRGRSTSRTISNRLLNVTDKLAQKRGDQYISSELFVLAAFEDKGPLARMFKDCRRRARRGREGDRRGARRGEASPTPMPRSSAARSRNTPSISPRAPPPASSIRSSAATRRSAAPSRCSRAAPRTIRC